MNILKLNNAIRLALCLTALLVAGCETSDGKPISYTPLPTSTYCIEGVLYYSMHNKLAPAFNTDSTIKLCN